MAGLIIYNPRVAAAGPRNMPGPALARPMVDMTRTADAEFGRDMAGSGVALGQLAAREMQQQRRVQRSADVLNAVGQYEADLLAFESDYYAKNRGADARDAAKVFEQYTSEAGKKYLEQFQGDREAALEFSRSAKQSGWASVRRAAAYGREQDEAHRTDTLNARKADLFQFAAGTDDDAEIQKRRTLYQEEARSLFPGRDMTAHFAETDREMTGNAIRQRLVRGDVAGAQAMLEERRGLLGTSYDEIAGQVRAEVDKADVMTRGDALIAKYKSNIAGALSEIRSTVTDPQQRAALEGRVKSEWSFRETMRDKAEREAKASRLDAAVQAIRDAATPEEVAQIIGKLPFAEQAPMYSFAERWGRDFVSDPVAVVQARDRILSGDTFSLDGEYGATINRKDRAELVALSGSEERKKAAALDNEIFANAWAKSGIDTAFSQMKGPDGIAAAKAELRLEYVRRVQEERADTPQKRAAIAFEVLAPRSVEDGGWFFGMWDSTITAKEAVRRQDDGSRVRYDVPSDAKAIIKKGLEEKGLPVNDDTIEQAFVQNKEKFGW